MQTRKQAPDIVARCEGAEYLLLAASPNGARFIKCAPPTYRRRDGGVVLGPDDLIEVLALLKSTGQALAIRRIEQ